MEELTFNCSICGEKSLKICEYCTKDTCSNHLCERCHRCSDCCTCESPLLHVGAESEEAIPEIAMIEATLNGSSGGTLESE